jgi:hypothetical protein
MSIIQNTHNNNTKTTTGGDTVEWNIAERSHRSSYDVSFSLASFTLSCKVFAVR